MTSPETAFLVIDLTSVHQALVVGRPVDVHGDLIAGVTAQCDRASTVTTIPSGGEFVVAGDVARVFPNLESSPDSITVTLLAPGRPPFVLDVAVPQGANPPLLLGDIAVPAPAVAIAGQVRRIDLNQQPIAGAAVRVVTDPSVPGLLPLALRTPLQAGHAATSTAVRAATVTPAVAATTCPSGARAGEDVLTVVSTAGIGPNAVLRFTPGIREHYAVVREVIAGLIVLRRPLTASVPADGEVRAVTVTPTGPTRQLDRGAARGDGLLALDADLTADIVHLADPVTGEDEVLAVGALTDASGGYRIGGVRGTARVAVKATSSGLANTQDPTVWRVDERAFVNVVDLGVQP